jgi:serine/threonine-protein kinase
MSESAGKAVFLSYASQDSEAARRIAEALRVGGVEVWLDQEGGLVGGDAWDRKIREQIHSCALFVPIISANTQARHEGYFRLEWKLAEDRSHLIAKGKPFIVPVSVDGTTERGALVPDAFLAVQWTKLPGGEAPAAFVARVMRLLGGPTSEPVPSTDSRDTQGRLTSAPPSVPIRSSEMTARNLELSGAVRPAPAFETFERRRPPWQRALPVVITAAVSLCIAGLVALALWPKAAPLPITRFTHALSEDQTIPWGVGGNVVAVSPDGRAVVIVTTKGLAFRKLGELEANLIPGTEGALESPCFSPDGQFLIYSSRATGNIQSYQLNRIAISGGTPFVIFSDVSARAYWGTDDTILFSTPKGIMRVPAMGGTPALAIAAQGEERLRTPQLLPDRDTLLFTTTSRPRTLEGARLVAQRISTGQRTVLVENASDARYVSTGHLIYTVGDTLMGVAFDPRQLVIGGRAVPLLQGVRRGQRSGHANYDVSGGGTLVFVRGGGATESDLWHLGLSDRAGKVTALPIPPGAYDTPRVSPDGTRIAVGVSDRKEAYIAIYDLEGRRAPGRLTFGGNNRYPVWSRDGQRVTFQSDREGDRAIYWQRADGTDHAERLTKPEKDTAHVPASWSPRDETLLFTVVPVDNETTGAIRMLTRASGKVAPFAKEGTVTMHPVFSPDGRWVAYASGSEPTAMDSERKIYLQPYPATGAQYEIPAPLGANLMSHPFWAPDGTTLYFAPTSSRFGVVAVTTQPTVVLGNPTELLRPFHSEAPHLPRGFDITPAGRFVGRVSKQNLGENKQEIHLVLNWVEELKRLVPVK